MWTFFRLVNCKLRRSSFLGLVTVTRRSNLVFQQNKGSHTLIFSHSKCGNFTFLLLCSRRFWTLQTHTTLSIHFNCEFLFNCATINWVIVVKRCYQFRCHSEIALTMLLSEREIKSRRKLVRSTPTPSCLVYKYWITWCFIIVGCVVESRGGEECDVRSDVIISARWNLVRTGSSRLTSRNRCRGS